MLLFADANNNRKLVAKFCEVLLHCCHAFPYHSSAMAPARRSQKSKTMEDSALKPPLLSETAPLEQTVKPAPKRTKKQPSEPMVAASESVALPQSDRQLDIVDVQDSNMSKNKRKSSAVTSTSTHRANTVHDNGEHTDNSDTPKPKRRKGKTVPSRSPLPDRNRQAHPGVPDKPRPKRTPAEVLADKGRKAKIAEELQRMEELKVRLLAQMELDEEEEEAEENRTVVRTLDDIRDDESVEVFTFDEVDAEESEESVHGDSMSMGDGKVAVATAPKTVSGNFDD